eukprot:6321721-Heterocapsa_arctica.AAC.1
MHGPRLRRSATATNLNRKSAQSAALPLKGGGPATPFRSTSLTAKSAASVGRPPVVAEPGGGA